MHRSSFSLALFAGFLLACDSGDAPSPTGGTLWKERDRLLATHFRAIIKRVVDGSL